MREVIDGHPPIQVEGVWKIFGLRTLEALDAVRTDNLTKKEVLERFDCVLGVADVTFSVTQGEIFCVMGLSGSGKSTLVRHINRLLDPSAGKVYVNGEDVMAMSELELRRLRNERVAMVFQHFGLMPHRTVRDNVAMPLEIRRVGKTERWKEAEQVLAMVGLTGWEDKYVYELSGGMQQRVGLARAIGANPAILLMDEPFSALDPLIRRQLQDQFLELSAVMAKTTVFITHDLDEAIKIGNRIAIMNDGRIVQVGRPEEIVMQPADDYVADFVAGISRLKFVHAGSLMHRIEKYVSMHGPIPRDARRASIDADLNVLMDLSIERDGPILIHDEDDSDVGVVDRGDILRGIKGGGESA